jgi:hypothetical protein
MAEKEKKMEKKREYGETSLALLREVKHAVDRQVKDTGVSCVLVSSIEKKVNRDPRTVRLQLKYLEEAEYGKFFEGGKLFCPKSSQEKTK